MPRLAEYVCDFARAGERALGDGWANGNHGGKRRRADERIPLVGTRASQSAFRASPSQAAFRASRMAMFRVYYLGGAEYQAARRHLGIGEITWADWAEEIRGVVGNELRRTGMFPPSRYFRETTAKAS